MLNNFIFERQMLLATLMYQILSFYWWFINYESNAVRRSKLPNINKTSTRFLFDSNALFTKNPSPKFFHNFIFFFYFSFLIFFLSIFVFQTKSVNEMIGDKLKFIFGRQTLWAKLMFQIFRSFGWFIIINRMQLWDPNYQI